MAGDDEVLHPCDKPDAAHKALARVGILARSAGPMPNDHGEPYREPNAVRPACVVSRERARGDDLVRTVEDPDARGRA